jgi:hypothetical protein
VFFTALLMVLTKLNHGVSGHIEKGQGRPEVIERLIELLEVGENRIEDPIKPKPEKPVIDFVTSVKRARMQAKRMSAKSWRELGILSASGYRVGATQGVREDIRRRLLNSLFLDDDLSDIDDVDYSAEWGNARTGDRLKKLVDSLTSFTKNAKRKERADMRQAISEWVADLQYLKATYYDRWGDFTWPDVEV